MKQLIGFLLIISLISPIKGQIFDQESIGLMQKNDSSLHKFSNSISIGTSAFFSKGIKGTNSYFVPSITYFSSTKFTLNTGIEMNYASMDFSQVCNENMQRSVVVRQFSQISQNVLFANGIYTIGSKVFLTGSISAGFVDNSNNSNGNYWDNSFKSMSLGISYFITNSIRFSAQMNMIQATDKNYPFEVISH